MNSMNYSITAARQKEAFEALREGSGYTNRMQAPRLVKVVVTSGVGSIPDKKRREYIGNLLTQIAGQKAAVTKAKKSIAAFKVRAGEIAGFRVTLRGSRMVSFVDKLIHIVLPRTRDFRGIDPKTVDEMGNVHVGIKEHTVFPEAAEADVKDLFGLNVTIVTSAKSKKEAESFLKHIGFPLR